MPTFVVLTTEATATAVPGLVRHRTRSKAPDEQGPAQRWVCWAGPEGENTTVRVLEAYPSNRLRGTPRVSDVGQIM